MGTAGTPEGKKTLGNCSILNAAFEQWQTQNSQ